MVAGALQLATRAFVRSLLALATQYTVTVDVNRDSSSAQLLAAYKRLCRVGKRTSDPASCIVLHCHVLRKQLLVAETRPEPTQGLHLTQCLQGPTQGSHKVRTSSCSVCSGQLVWPPRSAHGSRKVCFRFARTQSRSQFQAELAIARAA